MHKSAESDVGTNSSDLDSSNSDKFKVRGLHPAASKRCGGRRRDEQKRQLINEALDMKINRVKAIQRYVAVALNTGRERVSRKMISEVRKSRGAKGRSFAVA